jgi:hypothetical protein
MKAFIFTEFCRNDSTAVLRNTDLHHALMRESTNVHWGYSHDD